LNAGIRTNILDINGKIETEVSDREQIAATKKKLARELQKAKETLEDEKKETHQIVIQNKGLKKSV